MKREYRLQWISRGRNGCQCFLTVWPYQLIFWGGRDAYMPVAYKLFPCLCISKCLIMIYFGVPWKMKGVLSNISITNDFNEALKCCKILGTFFFLNIISLIVYMNILAELRNPQAVSALRRLPDGISQFIWKH